MRVGYIKAAIVFFYHSGVLIHFKRIRAVRIYGTVVGLWII